ncbi:MAG: class I SAM-dependent methyltransferase [Chloroflexi bacterium]|nr:class I SAM-dependent methyltransferase [Chloroflexota bacterium]
MRLDRVDDGRDFDWGKTSGDYATYRPGYPESFYDALAALGVGLPGQRILDLGTGTGVLARAFARRGAAVRGLDIAANQIEQARLLAAAEGLDIPFDAIPAEAAEFPLASFDAISAGQSWLYFDSSALIPKVLRWLAPEGLLVLTHLNWLPFRDPIAQQSEALVLRYNPNWKGAAYRGQIAPLLLWAQGHFDLKTFHLIHQPLPFTRDSWRGRIRACRGVGAALSPEQTEAFDAEHAALLQRIAPERFTILHQMSIHIYTRKGQIVDP